MCSVPPPPEPPALTPITTAPKEEQIVNINHSIDLDKCTWAVCPQLKEACFKNNICLYKPPFRYKYKYFKSIKQIGPTCGIVALSMSCNGLIPPTSLLDIAKLHGYTNNGEMFSCKHMLKLTETAHKLAEMENTSCVLKQGGLWSSETIESLLEGAVLLVPYDADCNHSPCLKNGRTAHWAIVVGVIVVEDPGEHLDSDPNNVFVLCKHGKSNYLAAWSLYELAQSNKNLYEFSPKKGAEGLVYILPEGGIGGENGLRDQFLLFQGLEYLNENDVNLPN